MNTRSDRQWARRKQSNQTTITAEDIKVHLRESAAVEDSLTDPGHPWHRRYALLRSYLTHPSKGCRYPRPSRRDFARAFTLISLLRTRTREQFARLQNVAGG